MTQHELFGVPSSTGMAALVAGLAYRTGIVDEELEQQLIHAVDGQPLSPFRFQGWLGKRLTSSFGWSYDFDKGGVAAAPPMPDWLLPVRDIAAGFAGLPANELVQALVIRYDPGAAIGWHRDRPMFEHVVGLSLGAPASLRLRKRTDSGFERRSLLIAPRSIYHLAGEVRHDWEHSITPMDMTRWSITFRSLSEKGRRMIG